MNCKPINQMSIEDFIHPFGKELDINNRWVKMEEMIPWDETVKRCAALFPEHIGIISGFSTTLRNCLVPSFILHCLSVHLFFLLLPVQHVVKIIDDRV